jgi:hypothetical protein
VRRSLVSTHHITLFLQVNPRNPLGSLGTSKHDLDGIALFSGDSVPSDLYMGWGLACSPFQA